MCGLPAHILGSMLYFSVPLGGCCFAARVHIITEYKGQHQHNKITEHVLEHFDSEIHVQMSK